MASSYFSVRLSTLQRLGTKLRDTSEAVRNGSTFSEAKGAEGYESITSALGDFKTDWENATRRLVEKTGNWGEKSRACGTFMNEHDEGLAASFRGEQV